MSILTLTLVRAGQVTVTMGDERPSSERGYLQRSSRTPEGISTLFVSMMVENIPTTCVGGARGDERQKSRKLHPHFSTHGSFPTSH